MVSRILYTFALLAGLSLTAVAQESPALGLKLEGGKVIAEIPQELLGRELLMASVIEDTSDPGEGVAGQMSDNCIPIIFDIVDSVLVVQMPFEGNPIWDGTPGDWKRYKVKSFTGKGNAVVDLSDFFRLHTPLLYTFPKFSYNSVNGQVHRVHTPVPDKSSFTDAGVREGISYVTCDFFYKLEGYVMGMMKLVGDYSFRAVVKKMIFLPRARTPLPALVADGRVGVNTVTRNHIGSPASPVESIEVVRRWRIEPSDSAAWNAGMLVPAAEPVVFHIDRLMPEKWVPYVREGVLAWNEAFEAAGLSDVLKVSDFPEDSFSDSPYMSRIVYASSGMEEVEVSTLTDDRNGEVFSAFICIHADAMKKWRRSLLEDTAGSDPRVRTGCIPDSIAGQIVKLMTMQAVGKALGLKENAVASAAYPVDSLRSRTFTERYGIMSSVMEEPVFNHIATPEDVQNGVMMIQDRPGPYDCFAISWLYGPDSARSKERMARAASDPHLKYRGLPEKLDPRVSRGDLGDDIFLSLHYWTENQKRLFANASEWFAGWDEKDVVALVQNVEDRHTRFIVQITKYVGGYASDGLGGYAPLPAYLQHRAVKTALACLRDMGWTRDVARGFLPYGSIEFEGEVHQTNVFGSLLERIDKLEENEKSGFLSDVAEDVFGRKEPRLGISPMDMVWQERFLGFLLSRREVSPSCNGCVQGLIPLIEKGAARASGEEKSHYDYLRFIIDKKD